MKKVVIDGGHGGDPASKRGFNGTGPEYNEGINNYLTVELIAKHLRDNYVVNVITTRTSVNDYPSLYKRAEMAKDADLFYSRHSNAFSDASVRGTEMWVGTGSASASKLSADLCEKLSAFFGHRNRGLKKGDSYIVVRKAKEAGAKRSIMAEVGFHTNKTDAKILVEKRAEIAIIEAEAIAKELKLEAKKMEKDTAQKWALENGIVADRTWDEPLTKHALVWILFDFWRKIVKGAIK